MNRYTSYKDSGIFWIDFFPSHWTITQIKNKYNIGRGRVISNDDLIDDGLYPVFSSQTKNNGCLGYINSFDFEEKLITWTTDGANAGTVFLREGKFNCTNVCGTLKPKNNNVNLEFDAYFLKLATQFYKRPDTNGAKIMNNEMAVIITLSPPLHEQEQIVSYLDKKTAIVDTLIASKVQKINLLKENRTALINHVITKGLNPNVKLKDSGVEWIGEIPEHWEMKKIKHLTSIISKGTTPSTVGKEISDSGEIRYLKAENIKDSEVSPFPAFFIDSETNESIKRSVLIEGDILFVIAGATIGKVAILHKDLTPANTNQAISFIRLKNKQNIRFVWYWLSSSKIQEQMWVVAVQSAQPNLSMENLGNFFIPLSPFSEQQEIVKYLDTHTQEIDELISLEEKKIATLKEYRQALISEVVTGKIKVVN